MIDACASIHYNESCGNLQVSLGSSIGTESRRFAVVIESGWARWRFGEFLAMFSKCFQAC